MVVLGQIDAFCRSYSEDPRLIFMWLFLKIQNDMIRYINVAGGLSDGISFDDVEWPLTDFSKTVLFPSTLNDP